MRFSTLAVLTAMMLAFSGECSAQCCGQQPTVAYSPVVAAPAVQSTTVVRNGWYPGKYLTDFTRSLFGSNQTTYTTNYAPTSYTAGYAPTPYTVGYAPSPYTAGYARTAYRPVYPATYGAVAYGPAPVVQTVSRPVVLSPVISASPCGGCGPCDACSGGGCSSCGVQQAGYYPSAGCSSCASGSCTPSAPSYSPSPSNSYGPSDYSSNDYGSSSVEPQPALPSDANVPPRERSIDVRRPEVEDSNDDTFNDNFDFDNRTEGDPAAANDYFNAPPLFPPANRVTQRAAHPAPARMAVYKRAPSTRPTAYRQPSREQSAPSGKVNRLSADAWTAGN